MSLKEIIITAIEKDGPISFHDYMEHCLYHPVMGYYSSAGKKQGLNGDYYTSPFLGSLFGQLIARQLEEMWRGMGQQPFTIVEYGAGNGLLSHDILKAVSNNEQFLHNISYYIIEKNSLAPSNGTTGIKRINDINVVQGIEGCVLSNELVDNFSVHRVIKRNKLMEVLVDYRHGKFIEVLRPAREELIAYFDELGIILPEGFQTEVNLEAINWINEVASHLHKGYVLTIDYGFPSYELYTHARSQGNLLCYHHHQLTDHLYQNIGEQDITAHVNFSALDHWGKKCGLDCTGFTNQSYFLMGLGITQHVDSNPSCVADPILLRTLMIDLGNRMKVLIQQKNLPALSLSGLRFPSRL